MPHAAMLTRQPWNEGLARKLAGGAPVTAPYNLQAVREAAASSSSRWLEPQKMLQVSVSGRMCVRACALQRVNVRCLCLLVRLCVCVRVFCGFLRAPCNAAVMVSQAKAQHTERAFDTEPFARVRLS